VNKLPIPPELNTPTFLEIWELWKKARHEQGHPLTPSCAQSQLAKLAKEGVTPAIQRIQQSINNQWQGLWFKGESRYRSKSMELLAAGAHDPNYKPEIIEDYDETKDPELKDSQL
jgi:hypothetical protein